jgi:hypothetical protein
MQVLVQSSGRTFFEEVLMFSHQEPHAHSTYITLHTDKGSNLTATLGHYAWVKKQGGSALQITPVMDVGIGDVLMVLADTQVTAFGAAPTNTDALRSATVRAITLSMQAGLSTRSRLLAVSLWMM